MIKVFYFNFFLLIETLEWIIITVYEILLLRCLKSELLVPSFMWSSIEKSSANTGNFLSTGIYASKNYGIVLWD